MKGLPAGWSIEEKFWRSGKNHLAGIDEVGRGAWAGPVVAAAVVFPSFVDFPHELYDSKMLGSREREGLVRLIEERAVSVGIGLVGVPVINKLGIGKATQKAFRAALRKLSLEPDHILIDAFYIRYLNREKQLPIKKGDQLCASIAAASIIAKVYRDSIMRALGRQFPAYRFGANKGYGTPAHQEAIRAHKFCIHHRKSFNLGFLLE